MNSNDYFLANKCGYGQCCNVKNMPSYINVGGFILSTRVCDDHETAFIRYIGSVMRAINQDPVCNDIKKEIEEQLNNTVKQFLEEVDKQLPYEKSKTFKEMKNEMKQKEKRLRDTLMYKPPPKQNKSEEGNTDGSPAQQ